MLQAWLSIGFIVLLAILVLALSCGAGTITSWPSPPSWWAFPSGLHGNTRVQRGRPGVITGTEVRRSDPDAAAIRPTSNTSTCATGPTGGLS